MSKPIEDKHLPTGGATPSAGLREPAGGDSCTSDWWCCGAGYMQHDPDCPNAERVEAGGSGSTTSEAPGDAQVVAAPAIEQGGDHGMPAGGDATPPKCGPGPGGDRPQPATPPVSEEELCEWGADIRGWRVDYPRAEDVPLEQMPQQTWIERCERVIQALRESREQHYFEVERLAAATAKLEAAEAALQWCLTKVCEHDCMSTEGDDCNCGFGAELEQFMIDRDMDPTPAPALKSLAGEEDSPETGDAP